MITTALCIIMLKLLLQMDLLQFKRPKVQRSDKGKVFRLAIYCNLDYYINVDRDRDH